MKHNEQDVQDCCVSCTILGRVVQGWGFGYDLELQIEREVYCQGGGD